MHHFFVPPEAIQAQQVIFPEEIAHQISRVLRLKPEQKVCVLDNTGWIFETVLEMVDGNRVEGRIINKALSGTEPEYRIQLYLCLTQREKFEWMLQKGTEIGVSYFVPVISNRSLIQKKSQVDYKKIQRWEKIIREASEQSGRGKIPVLAQVMDYRQALSSACNQNAMALIPWEKEASLSLKEALTGAKESKQPVSLIIGPEGGFSEQEISQAREQGIQPVTLGPRILRMETAAMVAAALVLYELGQME
jgi:16S rRNA (uracil1498-N3)-methyltransferase